MEQADQIAVQARLIQGALQLDATRPMAARAIILAGRDDDLTLDSASAQILLPAASERLRLEQQRLLFEENSGIRRVEPTSEPLGPAEFYASVADGWAFLTKRYETATAAERIAFLPTVSKPGRGLASLSIGGGVIPASQKREAVAKLWADVARDLKRGSDETDEIYALRREIQTSLGQLIEALVSELDRINVVVDASDRFTIDASFTAHWGADGQVASTLERLEPIPSRFAATFEEPAIARIAFHFRIPRAIARRFARWFDTAATIAVSLADSANREDLVEIVSQGRHALASALSQGTFDGFADVIAVGDRVSVQGAIALPSKSLLELVSVLASEKRRQQLPSQEIGARTFLRLGDSGPEKDSPFGRSPEFWVTADDDAMWFFFGPRTSVATVADRISDCEPPLQSERGPEGGKDLAGRQPRQQHLANFTLDAIALRDSLARFDFDRKARRIAEALAKISPGASPISLQVASSGGSLVVDGTVPEDIVLGLMTAFVDAKRDRVGQNQEN